MRTESDAARRVREASERAWFDFQRGTQQERTERPPLDSSFLTVAEAKFVDKSELERLWSTAVRGAARAQFPKKTAALRNAAYMAAKLVFAGRISEERAKGHLHRAARLSGVRPQEAERVIGGGYTQGHLHGLEEVARGCTDKPGAFSAVASASETYDHRNGFFVDPAGLLPLPPAVLVHRGHTFDATPVGIGIPTFRDGAVHLDAVFASDAGETWTLVKRQRVRSVSIMAHCTEFHRGMSGRLTTGTLVAIDLVRTPADEKATIGAVVEGDKLSPGQRQVQRNLDRYLADPANPLALDLFCAVERQGVGAMDILGSLVAPMRADRGRASTSPTLEDVSTSRAPAEGGEGEDSASKTRLRPPAPATRDAATTRKRCGVSWDGFTCDQRADHDGMHFGETEDSCCAWDDRALPRRKGQLRAVS